MRNQFFDVVKSFLMFLSPQIVFLVHFQTGFQTIALLFLTCVLHLICVCHTDVCLSKVISWQCFPAPTSRFSDSKGTCSSPTLIFNRSTLFFPLKGSTCILIGCHYRSSDETVPSHSLASLFSAQLISGSIS